MFIFSEQSKWIASKDGARIFRAIKKFNVQELKNNESLYVTADCFFVCWLNGIKLGTGPIRGSQTLLFIESYDISGILKQGENILAFEVEFVPWQNFVTVGVTPALRAQIPGIAATDESWQAISADDFTMDTPRFTMQSGPMECQDLRKEPLGWIMAMHTDSWPNAVNVQNAKLLGRTLKLRNIPGLKTRMISYKSILAMAALPATDELDLHKLPRHLNHEPWNEIGDRITPKGMELEIKPGDAGVAIIFEFDKEVTGTPCYVIDAPAGTVVEAVYGEILWNGRIRADFDNTMYYFTDCWILKAGENKFGPHFQERGFKMIQLVIRNITDTVLIKQVAVEDRRYAWPRKSQFSCSDAVLNGIWDMCQYTLETCATDTFVDCPWREHAFWVNDLLVENQAALSLFGGEEIHKRCYDLIFSQTLDNGLINAVIPTPDDSVAFVFPATNLFIIRMLRDYLSYTGDFETVKLYIEPLRKILHTMNRYRNAEGIIVPPEEFWNFFDWSFELQNYTTSKAQTSLLETLYIIAANDFNWLAKECDAAAEPIMSQSIPECFIDKETDLLVDFLRYGESEEEMKPTPLTNELSLSLGLLALGRNAKWLQAIRARKYLSPDYYLQCFVLEALHKYGEDYEALDRIRLYWGKCLAEGYGTLYEAGAGNIPFGRAAMQGCGSLCHGFGTYPVVHFQKVILGVEAIEPGYKRFEVKPYMFNLEYACGTVITPNGEIEVSWKRVNNKEMLLHLLIPNGLTAILPNGKEVKEKFTGFICPFYC